MNEFTAADLTVVIPTRERWDILGQTLSSLAHQSVSGFDSVIVVDGTDQDPPPVQATRVVVKRRAGPAAARNAGAGATDRPLVMFIGDDTIPAPDLVERHLDLHCRHPEREAAAVGFVDWHDSVARNRINRWLEWSDTQSWYSELASQGEQEVSHWYFYTSNLSLKRELFLECDGFDEDFPFAAFEDLECGLRLSNLGLRLYYEPAAVCHHLHDYDWPGLERRFASMALSERLMVEMHPDIAPGCLNRMNAARESHALPVERVVDLIPPRLKRLNDLVREQANRRYHRRLSPTYLKAWDRAAELCELRRYLGKPYDSARLVYGSTQPRVEANSESRPEKDDSDEEHLYALARSALAGTSDEAVSLLQLHIPPDVGILDYGCAIGSGGLRLARDGYSVQFADWPGAPLDYLRWRLAERGLPLHVYNLEVDELPKDVAAAVCLDAASPDRDPAEVLAQLEQLAPIVAIGMFPEVPDRSSTRLPSRTDRSFLAARHELARGSLLVYRRHHREPGPVDDPATADEEDGLALGPR